MKGITKAAKQAIRRSLRCRTCPYDYRNCTPAISRVCSDSFKDGFKKGVAWAKEQLKGRIAMNKETDKVIKEIVNKHFPCKECKGRKDCQFGRGIHHSHDCKDFCFADEFADGVFVTLKYLAYIPWEKAIKVIANSVKEDKQ